MRENVTCESVLFTYPARFGRPSRDHRDRNHLDATAVADSLVRRQGCQVLLSLCAISSRSSQGLIDDLLVGTFRDALPWTRTMALRNHVRCSMWYAVLVSTTLELRKYTWWMSRRSAAQRYKQILHWIACTD